MFLIAAPLIRRKPNPIVFDESSSSSSDSEQEKNESKRERFLGASIEIGNCSLLNADEISFKSALFNIVTLEIWILMVLSSSYPYYIASNFKSFAQKDIADDRFITIVGSIGAVFNGLSRGVWSSIQDHKGFKKVYFALVVIEIIVSLTMVSIHKVKLLYFIWVCLSFT